MRTFLLRTLLLVTVLEFSLAFSQNKDPKDSLSQLLKKPLADTTRVKSITALAWYYRYTNPDTAIIVATEALNLAKKTQFNLGLAMSYQRLGDIYSNMDNYVKAMRYDSLAIQICDMALRSDTRFRLRYVNIKVKALGDIANIIFDQGNLAEAQKTYVQALNLAEKENDINGIMIISGNLGRVFNRQGNYAKALHHYFQSLKAAEKMNAMDAMAGNLLNIGNSYSLQNDKARAMEYFQRAFKLSEEIKNIHVLETAAGNIGIMYKEKGDFKTALSYYEKALRLTEEAGHKNSSARNLGNIATVYLESNKPELSREYNLKALDIYKELQNKDGIAVSLSNLGRIFYLHPNLAPPKGESRRGYDLAEYYLKQSLEAARDAQDFDLITEIHFSMSDFYTKTRDFESSLDHYKTFTYLRDSLNNDDQRRKSIQSELNFEYQKKEEIARVEQEKKDAITAEEKQKSQIILISTLLGTLLIAAFTVILFKRFKLTQRQKSIIEIKEKETQFQKQLIEEKHK
jgi:tetratricopeptide (TPR) repeat protein